MNIYFATRNENKVKEIQQLVPVTFTVKSLNDLGFEGDIAETSDTITGNSSIKAWTIYDQYKVPVFADDTGLEVRSLDGAPGVKSARYAGENKSDDKNIDLLLKNMQDKPDTTARFITVLTYIDDAGNEHIFEGEVKGSIISERRGKNGFGYDPVFVPEGYDLTFAEMELEEKNKISHRARAMRNFINFLKNQ